MSLALARLAGVGARIGKARNLAEVAEIEGMDHLVN
jgi:hypothetical protein